MRRRPWPLLAVLLPLLAPTGAQANRAFAPRFSTNDTGAITIAANTLMTCPATAANCAAAQSASPANVANDTKLENASYDMQRVDVDDDPATVDSSSATLDVPASGQVLFAGLYFGSVSASTATRSQVKLRAPGQTGYTQLQTAGGAVDTDATAGFTDRYQGFVDVTDIVKAAGGGVYTVADVALTTGNSNRYGGWSLVVAYRDAAEPPRNLTVFDGLQPIANTSMPFSIPISGFRTPPTGAVRTELGFVGYEGELGRAGDTASLSGSPLSDPVNPQTNIFNSSLTRGGATTTGRNPGYSDTLGYDADLIRADGLLANDATSATIGVQSSTDNFEIGVITFATDLYAPILAQTKAVTDLDGGVLQTGDELQYRISGVNTGQDAADNARVTDALPPGLAYVPGSLASGTGAGTAARTDAAGDDVGEYDPATRTVTARVGTGATPTAGGRVSGDPAGTADAATYVVSFRARVLPTADNTVLTNTARTDVVAETIGSALTEPSAVTVNVRAPDLVVEQGFGSEGLPAGGTASLVVAVGNSGPAASTRGPLTLTETLPDGLSLRGATGTGWDCSAAGAVVTCTYSGPPLAPGERAAPLTLSLAVTPEARGELAVAGRLSGGGQDPAAEADVVTARGTVAVPPPPLPDDKSVKDSRPDANQLILECAQRKVVLTDVVRRGARVAIEGAADRSFAGQTATILFGAKQSKVATAVVAADGSFATTAKLPARKLRAGNGARYQAVIGAEKSLNLKLARRMIVTSSTVAGGKVTITGRITKPLARPLAPVVLTRRLTCSASTAVTKVKPKKDGTFTVTVDAPADAAAAVYRLSTRVPRSANTKRSAPTFTLPRGVNLLG